MEDQNTLPWYRGLTSRQWLILFVAWLGWVFDVADTALFNFAKIPMLIEMLGDRYASIGGRVDAILLSVFLVGWAIGGLFFGVLADRIGRSRTLFLTILVYCAFTGLTSLCQNVWQVGVIRFFTALGIGGEWAAGVALVAESLPARARAGAASFIQSAAAVGPIIAASGNLVLKGRDWRWLFVAGIFPAVLCAIIRKFVKEPETTGRALTNDGEGALGPVRELFRNAKWRRHTIVASIIGVVGIAGAGTATYWAPNLVKAISVDLPKAEVDARTSYITMLSHVGTLAGVFLVPWLCQVIGRKRTIFTFFLSAPISLVIALSNPTYERLCWLLPLVNFFAIGVSASFVLYFPELFPSRIRATGSGFAYNVGRLFYVPLPIITGALVDYFGGPLQGGVSMAVILTGSIYLVGLIAVPFAPETRGLPLPD